MLAKIVALFLLVVAALAILGRLRLGRTRSDRLAGRRPTRPPALPRPRLCPACNRLLVTADPCPCGAGGPDDGGTRQG